MKTFTVISIFGLNTLCAQAFSNNNIAFGHQHTVFTRKPQYSMIEIATRVPVNSLQMMSPYMIDMPQCILQQSTNNLSTYSSMAETIESLSMDSGAQATILGDMALALNIANFLTPKVSVIAQLLAIIGRIMCIGSDYIPDHEIMPDELAFQLTMLGGSMQPLARSMMPLVGPSFAPSTYQDKRAYCCLFGSIGLTWAQFRSMSSTAFEWVDVKPNATIVYDDNSLYWLYDGNIEVETNGVFEQYFEKRKGKTVDGSDDIDLLGNLQYDLGSRIGEKQTSNGKAFSQQERVQAGNKGSTMLRIDKTKLLTLMNTDSMLNMPVQSLLLRSIQQRINRSNTAKLA